jgi:hypothetical protein
MAFNYSELTSGAHMVTVRAVTGSGGYNDAAATFNVTRFPTTFISNPAAVNLAGASCSTNGNTLYLDNLIVEGTPYDLTLKWRTATQGFAITNITP